MRRPESPRFSLLSLALASLMLLLSQTALAVRVDNLYTVELPVADQTTAERLKLFGEAMKRVLVKISGDEAVLQHPGLQGPLKRAARFVQEYRYLNRDDGRNAEAEQAPLYLRVRFDADTLERLFREQRLKLWGSERPSSLLLLAVQEQGRLKLVADDTTPMLAAEINRLADGRGLPVLLPLNDLEDSRVLGPKEVRDRDAVAIASVSARYAPEAVLVGTLAGNDSRGWRGNWQLRFSGRTFDWSFDAPTRSAVIDQALARLARTLASEYALDTSMAGTQELLLTVEDVRSLDDLLRVARYLRSLEAIDAVRPQRVEPERVTFRLRLRNAAQDLSRLIALGDVLEQQELPQVQAGSVNALVRMHYRLLR